MLRSLSIKHFRLFRDLKMEPLSRVNLITGKNNTGKTALLEALYLLSQDDITRLSEFPSVFRSGQAKVPERPSVPERSDDFINFWMWLPYQKEWTSPMVIEATDQQGVVYSVRVHEPPVNSLTGGLTFQYLKDGNGVGIVDLSPSVDGRGTWSGNVGWPRLSVFPTRAPQPTEDAEIFNRAVLRRKKRRLLELLQVMEPQLTDLQYLKIGSEPLVYADMNLKELIPITQLGQGLVRLFRFFSEMLVAESQIVLIDEIENGIHYSVLKEMWKGMAAITRQEGLQVFATTHSWECIQAAHEVFQESGEYDFALHRLQRVNGDVQAVTHNQKMIEVAAKTDLEIRG